MAKLSIKLKCFRPIELFPQSRLKCNIRGIPKTRIDFFRYLFLHTEQSSKSFKTINKMSDGPLVDRNVLHKPSGQKLFRPNMTLTVRANVLFSMVRP